MPSGAAASKAEVEEDPEDPAAEEFDIEQDEEDDPPGTNGVSARQRTSCGSTGISSGGVCSVRSSRASRISRVSRASSRAKLGMSQALRRRYVLGLGLLLVGVMITIIVLGAAGVMSGGGESGHETLAGTLGPSTSNPEDAGVSSEAPAGDPPADPPPTEESSRTSSAAPASSSSTLAVEE